TEEPSPQPQEEIEPQGDNRYDPFARNAPPEASMDSSAEAAAIAEPEGRAMEQIALSPRISAQPANQILAPNDVAIWSLVGMDLDGLVTDEIVLEYNPEAIDVTALSFGSGLDIDPNLPPSTSIDRENGIIRIRSDGGEPLRFRSGGEIAHIAFMAVLPGDSPLVISKLDLERPDGKLVAATVTGARASVDFSR
ncbi:MAG: hypothetical protein R3338_13445, partial [Thermoanaerobaculia bacterium]|nr:hypothetical protein [Thermoanaerobaculia bacterium]